MVREHFTGSAHIEEQGDIENQRVMRESAMIVALHELRDLGAIQEWEQDSNKDAESGKVKQQIRLMEIGDSMEGMLEDGTRWKLERKDFAGYEVNVEEKTN